MRFSFLSQESYGTDGRTDVRTTDGQEAQHGYMMTT